MKYYILFKIFVRKLYEKRVRERASASNNLAKICLLINVLGFMIFTEKLTELHGFIYLSINYHLPLAPIAMVLMVPILILRYWLFPDKYNKETIGKIRWGYNKTSMCTKKHVLYYLILSILFLVGSIIITVDG